MSFSRMATLGVALAAACVLAGCGGDGSSATLSQSQADEAQAAAQSVKQMGPPPVIGGKKGSKRRGMGLPPVIGHR